MANVKTFAARDDGENHSMYTNLDASDLDELFNVAHLLLTTPC